MKSLKNKIEDETIDLLRHSLWESLLYGLVISMHQISQALRRPLEESLSKLQGERL